MSFQKVAVTGNTFRGLGNYRILMNPVFFKALKNSAFYTIVTLCLMIPVPLVLAAMLNSKLVKGKTIFRGMMFIPALTSVVVAGTIFRLIFGEMSGSFANNVVGFFGYGPLIWLRKPVTVWIALFLLCLWRWTGVNMMYYLAGLQQIPSDLYESAEVDGANFIQKFFHITIPMLKPTTIYVLTISIYGGMSMFTESYILFNGNSSTNNVGLTIVGYLYRMGWEQNNIGLASATGCVLLGIVMLINVIQLGVNGAFSKRNAA
ncbi:MAG: sugar ABC transporter permease [Sphaerochaetaceae bacterium]